jgi:hypothetical protein
MTLLEWRDDSHRHEEVDHEHRALIELINALHGAREDRSGDRGGASARSTRVSRRISRWRKGDAARRYHDLAVHRPITSACSTTCRPDGRAGWRRHPR